MAEVVLPMIISAVASSAMGKVSGGGSGGDNGAVQRAEEQNALAQSRQLASSQEQDASQSLRNQGALRPRTGRRSLVSGDESGLTDSTLG